MDPRSSVSFLVLTVFLPTVELHLLVDTPDTIKESVHEITPTHRAAG
jgi:hypothetical protein